MLTEMYLRSSSMTMTGALINKTACHSGQFNGVIAKRVYSERVSIFYKRKLGVNKTCREERNIKDHEVESHA